MAESEPKSKLKETHFLRWVIVVLVLLYVVLTAYVLLTNQTIGSTQLGYSALHTSQLEELQTQLAKVSGELAALRRSQDRDTEAVAARLNELATQAAALSNALMQVEGNRQNQANAAVTQLETVRKQVAHINTTLSGLAAEQSRFTGGAQSQLVELQNRLASLTNALTSVEVRQKGISEALAGQLAALQKDVSQLGTSRASYEFLSGQLDDVWQQARKMGQVGEAQLATATRLWRRAQLLVDAAQTEPTLAEKAARVTTESVRLQGLIARAMPAVVEKYHRAARTATATNEAVAAWTAAGEWLELFPVTGDPATMSVVQRLVAEHEAIRQQLQPRSATTPK